MDVIRYKEILEEARRAEHPLLVCDERIDGDSLGSALAFVDLFKQLGLPRPRVFVAADIPAVYHHLPHLDTTTRDATMFSDPTVDLVIVFDCSDDAYVERLLERAPLRPKVINIDHHKTNALYGDINLVVVDAPATAEVVYQLFDANGLTPSAQAAACLLTGLCFDTTAFSNSATNERALETASRLVLCGARVQDALRSLFKSRSVSALRVWGSALERLHLHPDYGAVITCITREDLEKNAIGEEEVEGLSNFLSLVTDTDSLFVLRETPEGDVKVSMRSQTRDVSEIAREKGGGGHARAAGYTVKGARLACGEDGCWRVELKEKK
ncbi:hypothetical protein FJZ23_02370 [Candidatus Parcubacteria bacterium]|nr:hypothetical protein [Candidatus Parcubacteria bacterium]